MRVEHAGSTRIGYEAGVNALARLEELTPRFAKKLVRLPNYANSVVLYLRAVDLYCRKYGLRDERSQSRIRVRTHVQGDAIVQVITHR